MTIIIMHGNKATLTSTPPQHRDGYKMAIRVGEGPHSHPNFNLDFGTQHLNSG